jgi:hypothetical protein
VGKARELSSGGQLDTRVGRDGKVRKMPKPPAPKPRKLSCIRINGKRVEPEMPTQAEADESFQSTLYEEACLMVDEDMSGPTRQRFFAHLRRKYNETFTQSPAQRAAKGLPA